MFVGAGFKPQRAASSIPTLFRCAHDVSLMGYVSNPNGPPHPFQREGNLADGVDLVEFQTQTGRLIHSNCPDLITGIPPENLPVSNPNGPPHPFQLGFSTARSISS